jgi:hypothetical protein
MPRLLLAGDKLAGTERAIEDFAEFARIRSGRLLRFAFWMTGSWRASFLTTM